jgi:hypothetical protein
MQRPALQLTHVKHAIFLSIQEIDVLQLFSVLAHHLATHLQKLQQQI